MRFLTASKYIFSNLDLMYHHFLKSTKFRILIFDHTREAQFLDTAAAVCTYISFLSGPVPSTLA